MSRDRTCACACVAIALLLVGCVGARVKAPSREALACALDATREVEANACADAWLSTALDGRTRWTEGESRINGSRVVVEFRALSSYLAPNVAIAAAEDIPVWIPGGVRHRQPGFGIPLAVISGRCDNAPVCELLPYSGVFRPATAWLERDADADARLVIGNPLRIRSLRVGEVDVTLAEDTTAAYAAGMRESPIGRLAIWGLLGGDEVAHRAGVYLMEDYDPDKRPLVMLHGLGSSPLVWARLSNDVWGDRALREQFQVWHVVYSTDTPLLVTRRRIANFLDRAFEILDPEHDDPAREGIVIIGHSLGGVIARLLSADSGDTLWSASFTVPPSELEGDAQDVRMARELLVFTHYPGIHRAIFLAAPHRGSPLAMRWYSRIAHTLAGRRADEMQALRRIARAHPEAIQPAMREGYQAASINSISTLQEAQPVRLANETLLPVPDIAYHTIAGRRSGTRPEGDGVVPLASALLPGATSTAIFDAGHDLYSNPDVVAEALRILHDDIEQNR